MNIFNIFTQPAPSWKVAYGCSRWRDADEGLTEEKAKARYAEYCQNPPMRGGMKAKYVSLHDDKGTYVLGFAAGGPYGKVA